MAECDEESLYIVDSEGDHKQKTFLASCDRHRRVENGDQEVPCGDLMAEVVSKTDTWSSKPMPAPTEGDDENIDDGCLVSSDQIKFNLEPMCETYRSAVYAMRPEFEEKVLVKNIISKVHNNAGGFLSDREEDEVMAYRTNLDRMYSLLKILRTKSNKHFMTFYKALESSGYQHFATQLKKAAGINCKPPKDPGPKATHKILKEKKVAYSLHSVIEKLKAPFSTVQGEFRIQVRSLSDDLYDKVVALCQTTMAAKAHKSRLPDVPSHRKDFIEHIIKHTTFFDIELIHEVTNLLQQPTLTEAVVNYEADLEPLMRTTIAKLTDRCEVMPVNQDSPEGTYRLVLKFPDDANISDLYEAKDYLEKVLHIPDAKLLAFDFGCILAYFEITCTDETLKNFPKRFTKHSDQLKAMGISGAFLIDHWAWGADDEDVWYTDDESDDMEVNDQRGFLGNRKRSHLGSVSGGCTDIVPSKKASQLKENCPTKKESGDRQGTAEEDCYVWLSHSLMPCTEERIHYRMVDRNRATLNKMIKSICSCLVNTLTIDQHFLNNLFERGLLDWADAMDIRDALSKGGNHAIYLFLDRVFAFATEKTLERFCTFLDDYSKGEFRAYLGDIVAQIRARMEKLQQDGDLVPTVHDYNYQTNLRSSKLLKLCFGKCSTHPAHRRLSRKRRNRLKAISSSAQSLNCHYQKSQRTIHTSHTSHTSSFPCLAQPQTSSVHSDPTDEDQSARMDQTDSGLNSDQ